MAFYVQGMPSKKDASTLALSKTLATGVGDFVGSYFSNKALEDVLNDPAMKDAPVSERMSALESKLRPFGERGKAMLASRLGIEKKQEEEGRQEALADIMDSYIQRKPLNKKSLAKLPQEMQLKVNERVRSRSVGDNIAKSLKEAGVPDEVADNAGNFVADTERGTGQTHAIQQALELKDRYGIKPDQTPFQENVGSGKFSKMKPDFEFPLPEESKGLSSKERAAQQEKYAKENMDASNKNLAKKRALNEDKANFNKLSSLNPNISTGFDKWNINPLDGKPIIAAWASPEEREFAKIIVQQLRHGKDTFGARITNFEADKFLEGFPSLADSPEARDAIIKDLKVINEINLLYSSALDEVYRTYKPGQLPPGRAEQIAEDMVGDEAQALMENYGSSGDGQGETLEVGEVMIEWQGKKYGVKEEEIGAWIQAGGKRL